jgi:hypothetical protein
MNYASDDQLTAVAQSCKYYNSGQETPKITMSARAEEISCGSCKNWDGTRCTIDVFDKVLTSLDQT